MNCLGCCFLGDFGRAENKYFVPVETLRILPTNLCILLQVEIHARSGLLNPAFMMKYLGKHFMQSIFTRFPFKLGFLFYVIATACLFVYQSAPFDSFACNCCNLFLPFKYPLESLMNLVVFPKKLCKRRKEHQFMGSAGFLVKPPSHPQAFKG